MTPVQRVQSWLFPLALIALVLLGWQIAVRLAETPDWMLPAPTGIARAYRDDWSLLWSNTRVTLVEVLLGFLLAAAAGLLAGGLMSASRVIERALYPILIASQTIPMVVLAPLFLIWFGYGLLPKVLVTALVAFFPLAVNTFDGLVSTDRELLALLRSMGASPWQRFRLARLPSALAMIFTGARVAMAFCVIGAVFGEFVGAKSGLGYLIQRSASQFETARIFAAIGILAALGVGLFCLVILVERLVMPWRRHIIGGGR